GSYPFLTMCSVMVAGWLVERLARAPDATDRDRAAAEFFLTVVVPEALGLAAGAECGAAMLYAVPAEALA
ncbi:MAG TPA: acyl-CoA dehydrogenase, partial [Sphingomicrobium sp.]|nr:acyl-CoA dehydrogenase [Sphingomicrobium sp.]